MSVLAIGLVLYGVVALLALRPVVGHFAWEEAKTWKQVRPDSGDWWFCVWKGVLVASLWPVLLIVFACAVLANRTLPKIGAEREAERKIREQRLQELERELGLDQ